MNETPIAQTLRYFQERNNWTQAELARRLGISPQYLSDLVAGRRNLSPRLALALERVTGRRAAHWLEDDSDRRLRIARAEMERKI